MEFTHLTASQRQVKQALEAMDWETGQYGVVRVSLDWHARFGQEHTEVITIEAHGDLARLGPVNCHCCGLHQPRENVNVRVVWRNGVLQPRVGFLAYDRHNGADWAPTRPPRDGMSVRRTVRFAQQRTWEYRRPEVAP